MENDPQELNNVAGDPKHTAICAELSKLVNAYAPGLRAQP